MDNYLKWSNFTLCNYKKLHNVNIINNKLLIDKMNFDKEQIIKINDIIPNMSYIKIDKNILIKNSDIKWVYQEGFLNDLNNLDIEIKIEWNENIIYLKCYKNKLIKILNRIIVLIKLINYINKNNEKIIIFLILTKLKKNYDKNKYILEAKHINSGYTDTKYKYIFIWREEEFEKVLFHEIIHLLNKDHRNEKYTLDMKNNHLFYEAITDVKAIYYNIIYLSILSNENINKLMVLELNFMINQANLMESLINTNYICKSPVLSYYIIKTKIFKYLFSDIMNENIYNDLFIKNVYGNELINNIYHDKIIKVNYKNFNSTRMTLLELN